MKIIKKLNTRRAKNGHITRWALFYCSYCNQEVGRFYQNGLKNKSCGCVKGKLTGGGLITHGRTCKGQKTKLYNAWNAIKQRCYNPNDKRYKDYGGRGIMICDEWKNNIITFETWALNNGCKDNLQIDRRNNDGNYEPSNCRWSTRKEQAHNKNNNTVNWLTVRLMRALYEDGYTRNNLFEIFDISKGNLRHILNNRTWKEKEQ